MLSKTEVLLVTASLLGRLVHCQSVLKQESLSEYPLAVCNDGSPAVYYHEEVRTNILIGDLDRATRTFDSLKDEERR